MRKNNNHKTWKLQMILNKKIITRRCPTYNRGQQQLRNIFLFLEHVMTNEQASLLSSLPTQRTGPSILLKPSSPLLSVLLFPTHAEKHLCCEICKALATSPSFVVSLNQELIFQILNFDAMISRAFPSGLSHCFGS